MIGWATTRLYRSLSPFFLRRGEGAATRRLWKPKQWRLNRVLLAKVFLSRYFSPTSWILLKQLFLSPSSPLSQLPIPPSASWAIDSEPIWAQGIIVNYTHTEVDLSKSRAQIFSRARAGHFSKFSATKANERAGVRLELRAGAYYRNRKWEAKDSEKV